MGPSRPLPRDAFARHLAGLEPDGFAAFLADLYEARGWDVEREGRVLSLRRGDDDRRDVLAVARETAPARDDAGSVDRVVAAGRPSAVGGLAEGAGPVHGPADLYDLLLYGIDRATADRICRDHLGRGIEARPGERDASDRRRPGGRRGSGDGAGGAVPGVADRAASDDSDGSDDGSGWPGVAFTERRFAGSLALLLVLAVVAAGVSGGLGGSPLAGPRPTADAGSIGTPSANTGGPVATPIPTTSPPTTRSPGGSAGEPATDAVALERRYVGLTPTCERPPELVALIIVGALRNNDPETNDGVRTAWNFSSRASPGATYSTFAHYLSNPEFEPLLSADSVAISLAYPEPTGRAYRVTVTGPTGDRHAYHLAFSKRERGDREGCWVLAGIVPQ